MASKTQLCHSVLITGCNRGIGLQFVKVFLGLSPPPRHVFATCRSLESAKDLKQLQSENPNLHLLELDVVDSEAIERVVGEVTEKLNGKGLNILLNNAGILDHSQRKLEDVTVETMMKEYRTNAVAPLLLTRAFLPLLKKASSDPESQSLELKALILNMSSAVGSVGDNRSGGAYSYRASKAALNIINKSLSIDLKSYGIWAVLLHPGWVKTEMGTTRALIDVEECVTGLMKVITSLDESKNGLFFNYRGEILPW